MGSEIISPYYLLPGSSVNRKTPLADKGRSSHNARRATDVYRERRSVQDSLPQIQIPAQLVLYAIPCTIYAIVQRLRGRTWSQIASNLGLRSGQPIYYGWALVFFVVLGLLSLVTIYVFFPGYYDRPASPLPSMRA